MTALGFSATFIGQKGSRGQRAPENGYDRRNERASLASREEKTNQTKPQKPRGRARLDNENRWLFTDSSGHSRKG